MSRRRMPSKEWVKVWIYLNFVLGVARSARPRFDTSTDMEMVLVPADAEVDSVIFRLRATDQDADFPLVFDIAATVTPVVRVENLPCTLYNKICQANVILTRRLTAGRLHDFAVRVKDSKGDSNSMQATISVTNATTQRDRIFPHIPAIIMVPEDEKPGKELDYVLARANQWSGKPVYIELWDPYTEPKKDTRNIAGLHLVVIIQDVQDVPPIFTYAPPLTKINNTIQPGDVILRVHAEDGDKGVPREVTYGLVSEGNPFTPFFNISESTGEIILTRPLEELTQITHVGAPVVLSVIAEEIRRSPNEPPAQATVVEVGLLLGEPGNSPPYFENDNYVAWMDENPEPGSLVVFNEPYSTQVKDKDIGKAGVFALKLEDNNGTFEISPTVAEKTANFILSVRDNTLIDYEVHNSLQFKIVAQEVGPATNLSASVPVMIFLRDVNDNPPEFQEALYEVTLSENVTAGTRVVQVHATDKDTGSFGKIQYTRVIGPGSEAFVMNPDTGFISVAMGANNILDREFTPQLRLTVEARDEDGRGLRGSVPLIINLLDVNDNAPIFQKNSYDFVINGDLTNFTVPAIIKATDADAEPPNNEVRYELIHGNYENYFFLNEVSGEIFLRKQITKVRTTRHNPYQELASKFKKTMFPSYKGSDKLNSSNSLLTPSTIYTRNESNSHNQIETIERRKRQDTEKNVLFTLTARAYDLGVPHLSGTTQVNILQSPLTAARIVMFVIAGENPDPVKTAETLATITGGHITVKEIRPYVPGSSIDGYDTTLPTTDGLKRSIVVARVEPIGGTSLVDIDKIRTALVANGVGVIGGDMPSTNRDPKNGGTKINNNNTITSVQSEEVTIYRAENKLLFWILIILGLLILATIIALIICCICPGCPFYMAPRKRRIHSSETLMARSDGRPKRHLHRKYPMMMQDPNWSERKQAWSADPMKSNWQFNRRNTKQYGLASLPGDVVRIPDLKDRYPRKAISLRGDPQIPVPLNDPSYPLRQQAEHRIYMENIERAREYEAVEMDSLRRHEFERGSDLGRQPHGQMSTRHEHHYYRDGNAEVMRLVSRGGVEETSATMHRAPQIIIDPANGHRVDGKNILLQRFIEDQKLRAVSKEYQDALQEDFERQSMESHQRQRELSMHQQKLPQQEILLIPEKLEADHRQHLEQLGPDVQKLIIDHGTYEKFGRSGMHENQDILTGATLLIPMGKHSENPEETGSVNLQNYTMHDLELATQNVLLTRLLLERDGRVAAGVVDPASYLETQSLPGQVATGTQTDKTTATQTEHQSRSRSDNESEEESKIRKKMKFLKRYGEEPKRITTLWMRSPIEEEERLYPGKRMNSCRKMRDIKDGRKISIEPEVLQEISDSLDETGEVSASFRKASDILNLQYESKEEELIPRRENSSSLERMKDTHKKKTRENKVEKGEKRKKIAKSKNGTGSAPSFRILEKEMSSLSRKLSKLTGREASSEGDSGEKERGSHIQQEFEKMGLKEHQDERRSSKAESKIGKRTVQKAIQSITKERLRIKNKLAVDESKQKSKPRKILPISTASSDWEEPIEKSVKESKTQTKEPERSKLRLSMGRTIHPKLRRQGKLEMKGSEKSTTDKTVKSETESGTVKLSSSEPDHIVLRDKPTDAKKIQEISRTPINPIKEKEKSSKSSSSQIRKSRKSEVTGRTSRLEAEKPLDYMEAPALSKREHEITNLPMKSESLKSTTDVESMEWKLSDKRSVGSSPDIKAIESPQREQSNAEVSLPFMKSHVIDEISTEMNETRLDKKRERIHSPVIKTPIRDDNPLDAQSSEKYTKQTGKRHEGDTRPSRKLNSDIESVKETRLEDETKNLEARTYNEKMEFRDKSMIHEPKLFATERSYVEPSQMMTSSESGMSVNKGTISAIESPKTPSLTTPVVQAVNIATGVIVEKAKTAKTDALETVKTTTEDAKNTIGGIFEGKISKIKTQGHKTEDAIKDTEEEIGTNASNAIERIQTIAGNEKDTFHVTLEEKAPVSKAEIVTEGEAKKDILNIVHVIPHDAKDFLTTTLDQKVLVLKNKSEEVRHQIGEAEETTKNMVETAGTVLSGAIETAESFPKNLEESLRMKIEKKITEFESGISEFIDSGIHKLTGNSNELEESKNSGSTHSQTAEMEQYLPIASPKKQTTDPPTSPFVDTLQIGFPTPKELQTLQRIVQSSPPVDITVSSSLPDLTPTKTMGELKTTKDGREHLECSSLDSASIKSSGSQSPKSIIVVRETSFLNSPKRESPEKVVPETKSETNKSEVKKDISTPEKTQMDTPTLEPSEMQIPYVNIEAPTPEIAAVSSDLKIDEKEDEIAVSLSRDQPVLPEMSLEILDDDDSDLSSESSMRTSFIAQPYGTPRHRELVRAERVVDDCDLSLSSTSPQASMDNKQKIEMVSPTPQVASEESEYSGELKTSRLVGTIHHDVSDIDRIGITEGIKLKKDGIEVEDTDPEIIRKEEFSNSKIGGEKTSFEDRRGESETIEPKQVELLSKTREILPDDGSTSALLPDISKVATRRGEVKTSDVEKKSDTISKMIKSVPTGHTQKPDESLKKRISKNKSFESQDLPKESKESKISPMKGTELHKKLSGGRTTSRTRKTKYQEPRKSVSLETKPRVTNDCSRMTKQPHRDKEFRPEQPKIKKPKKSMGTINDKEHLGTKVAIAITRPLKRVKTTRDEMSKSGVVKKSSSSSEIEKDKGVNTVQTCPDQSPLDPSKMESTSRVEKSTTAMIRQTVVESLPTITIVDTMVSNDSIELQEEPTEKQGVSVSETLDSTSNTLGQLMGLSVQLTKTEEDEICQQDTKDISLIVKTSQRTSAKFSTDIKLTDSDVQEKFLSPTKSSRHLREDTPEAQSRYMAWYKEIHERREGEYQEEPPKWLRKSTRQKWLKMSPEDRKHFDLTTPEVTPLTRRKIRPLKNVESEQLKAIVRQGRRLRRAEGKKFNDPQIEIFSSEIPPPPSLPPPPPKYHHLIQHSEYKYEKTVPFYLHPPRVPHPSPQISPRHLVDSTGSCLRESRHPDEDIDSGIVLSMSTGGRLRHHSLLEKKSVFDIAYSEAAPSQLRADSTTPPS